MQVGNIWFLRRPLRTFKVTHLRNCGCCNRPIESKHEASIDHFWPRSLGGSNESHNLWGMHNDCNKAKGNRMPTARETMRFSQLKGFCDASS